MERVINYSMNHAASDNFFLLLLMCLLLLQNDNLCGGFQLNFKIYYYCLEIIKEKIIKKKQSPITVLIKLTEIPNCLHHFNSLYDRNLKLYYSIS